MEPLGLALIVGPGTSIVGLPFSNLVLGYMGPDTIMPLGSAIAAGIGIILMFWNRFVRLIRKASRRIRGGGAVSLAPEKEDLKG